MYGVMLSAALAAAANDVEVQTLEGQVASGRLVALSAEGLALETSTGRTTLPIDSLATLGRRGEEDPELKKAALWLQLADQSTLPGTQFNVKGKTAKITLLAGRAVELPTKAVRWVRFSGSVDRDGKLAEQWTEITKTQAAGDLLVIRRSGSLDYLEGVQHDVDAESCHFEADDEVLKVNRARVEGIVYFHPRQPVLKEPLASLSCLDGSRLTLSAVALDAETLNLTLLDGTTMTLPLAEVARIDFSSGKIAYLSDLDPDSASFTPYLGFQEELAAMNEYYRFRRDVGFEQTPLRLDGTAYAKGLSLRSRTLLSYKLPAAYRTFKATVGIDDSTRETGIVRMEIKGDGRVLWQGDVRGSDPPRELSLEIAGVKRFDILVDYGEDQDIGDRLNLADARVTK